ncbi:MAG: hypothetical protein E6J16_06770 [Chloroflexota bacterium]|nr:MAG: hypothetical protein E6J16_06770 [Chloroflexota bacterium]
MASLGFGLLAAALGVLGAGSSGPAAIRYELNAPLLATGGRDGGGDHGSPWSQPMRLVGTWDGQALTLTEAPQVAQTPPGLPPLCTQDFSAQPEPDSTPRQIEVIDALQSRGVDVLESAGCDRATVGVLVVVADDATVDWITTHYRVNVVSWLRRLPSGP